MDLKDLAALITPPAAPFATGSDLEWEKFQTNNAIELPMDYRELISKYGAGDYLNFLGVLSPFAPKAGLLASHASESQFYRALQKVFPVYPDDQGLLCVGADENGDKLFWLTGGVPDSWPVVFFSNDFIEFERYDHNLTTFLVRWLRGDIEPPFVAPLRLLKNRPFVFTPHK